MISLIAPCKDCSERHLSCHDECQRYKEYKNNIVKTKNARSNNITLDSYFQKARINSMKLAGKL